MKIFITLMMVLFFVGCGEKIVYVPKVEVKYKHIPKELLTDNIHVTKPPAREKFIKASPVERESMLAGTIMELYGSIKLYKNMIKDIKRFDENLTKVINDE